MGYLVGVPRISIEASPSVAKLLRERRKELGLSLREVEEKTETLGRPIPFTTLARVERGRVDPGVKRLRLLLRLYDVPLGIAEDLLDLEEFAGELPAETTPGTLYEEGIKHWKTGDLRQALAHLFALRSQVPKEPESRAERQRALLGFAVAVGGLGKFRLSRQIVEDLLLEPPVPELLVRVLVQIAACWHSLGSETAAAAFLSQAESLTSPKDHRERAWIAHLRASALSSMGRHDAATAELERAIKGYRQGKDVHGESRALAVRFRILFEQGDYGKARQTARLAREEAERHGFKRLAVMRRLEEARAALALRDTEAGLDALAQALAESVATQDPVMQFYAHYYLWKAHADQGDKARAQLERDSAQYYVRFVDEATPETKEIRAMLGVK